MAAHPPDLLRIRPLESRMRGNLHVRFGGGRMEKDAAGSSKGRKNSDISRTSPAAYPTITSPKRQRVNLRDSLAGASGLSETAAGIHSLALRACKVRDPVSWC